MIIVVPKAFVSAKGEDTMKSHPITRFLQERRGAAGMMTALLIIIFVAILAIVIDLGHLHGVRNELQNAADAAALAGARALIQIADYPVVPVPDPPYCGLARTTARETAQRNKSDGTDLTVSADLNVDVQLGWWDWETNTWTYKASGCALEGANAINAVNVVVRRNAEAGSIGPVAMTLAALFGWETANVKASSTAAVGYLKKNCTFFLLALLYKSDPDSWFQKFISQIPNSENPGTHFLTLNTGSDKDKKMDEGAWADMANNGYAPANFIKNYFKGRVEPGCVGAGDEVDLQGGVDTSILHSIKDKLADLRSTAGSGNDQWNHSCQEYNYEGWLMCSPIVQNDQLNQTSPIVNPESNDGWGNPINAFIPIIIRNIYNPNDKNAPPECSTYQGHCIEMAYYPCPAACEGEVGGPAGTIFGTRPKLVQFDWFPSAD